MQAVGSGITTHTWATVVSVVVVVVFLLVKKHHHSRCRQLVHVSRKHTWDAVVSVAVVLLLVVKKHHYSPPHYRQLVQASQSTLGLQATHGLAIIG